MVYTLQLALAGGLKACGCRAQVDALIRVVRRFRKTQLAAERLHTRSELNLQMPCITRWNFLCYAVERYRRVKDPVVEVAKEMGWDMQTITKNTKVYEGLVRVTKLIRDQTEVLQGDRYTTISNVYPAVLAIKAQLDSFQSTWVFRSLSQEFSERLGARGNRRGKPRAMRKQEFKRRVAKVIDPHSPDFDPIYVVDTVLDPNNACLVDDGLIEAAETALVSMARVEDENANSLYIADTPAESLDHPMMLEQTAKFGYAKIILQRKKNMANAVGSESLKSVIAAYVASMLYEPSDSAINLIAYWGTEKRLSFLMRVI
ncbi:hypothetical protein Tcan_09309 [Toxocara canis]|uniref:Uncharacterized protein n=1 Tax=Toxocara canis TaxID=6265 RepID=A0A0B2VD16_TOXCA|nr:hypothetical protein Tcan_09309 [Toxocara canis]